MTWSGCESHSPEGNVIESYEFFSQSYLQTLGNVDGFNATAFREGPNVDNEFVGASSILVGIQNFVVRIQTLGHVVGVQDGQFRGLGQTFSSHHLDVRPGNGKNAG